MAARFTVRPADPSRALPRRDHRPDQARTEQDDEDRPDPDGPGRPPSPPIEQGLEAPEAEEGRRDAGHEREHAEHIEQDKDGLLQVTMSSASTRLFFDIALRTETEIRQLRRFETSLEDRFVGVVQPEKT